MRGSFKKITPFNGFDKIDTDNGKQNNYAWSMAELGEYLYVGTGRNIVYSVFTSGILGSIPPPPEFTPKHLDMRGEIWRYKKDGSKDWELVYKAPETVEITGFRFMIQYTTPSGETALYAGAYSKLPNLILLKSTDGIIWIPLQTNITSGNSTRAMIVHGGKLYMSTITSTATPKAYIYVNTDPENKPWELVTGDLPEKNPAGEITVLHSFNGRVYAGVSISDGFEIWRSEETAPQKDNWKLVVDKGAGDALNEIPLSMCVFKNYLYVGSAMLFAIKSVDPTKGFLQSKGFDLIRIDANDSWKLVVGGDATQPVEPTTGKRNKALSGLSSGFGYLTNAYCWQLTEFNGYIYLGTWDWSDLTPPIYNNFTKTGAQIPDIFNNTTLKYIVKEPMLVYFILLLIKHSFGFDLWKSKDGVSWTSLSINGFNNPRNYGIRNLFPSDDGDLYVGTANPFQGCEVWVRRNHPIYHDSSEESTAEDKTGDG